MKLERLLVCLDGSAASIEAARAAIDLASQTNARLLLLSVVDSRRLEAAGLPGASARVEADAKATLDRVTRMAGERGVEAQSRLRTGRAVDVILEETRAEKPDVIVMGRTGRHGPGSGMLGTSALHVAEFSDRPLLLVPAART